MVVAVLLVTAGCLDGSLSKGPAGELEANQVDSVPDDATVIDYNSSALDEKSTIRLVVEGAAKRGHATTALDPGEYERVSDRYKSLNTSYVRYQDNVVRVALLTEQ